MILYWLYRLGYFMAMYLPLGISYSIGARLADACYLIFASDRRAVINNLKLISGEALSDEELASMAREVFRNFAKYLADFFRSSLVDDKYIKDFVKLEGLENVDRALSNKKGVILLSAHIGNWELGGLVMSMLRRPMAAVVLTHKNKRINDFFTRQRSLGSMKPVEIGMSLRGAYRVLANNGLLAVLGDRDFTKSGLEIEFFGKPTVVPKGPAIFSYRMGSAIVPVFMIREKDDTFRLIFDCPIFPDTGREEDTSVKELAKKYSATIESYVRKYPTQWYMFRDVWNHDDRPKRTDTVL